MIRFLITSKCGRGCEYCISKNVTAAENMDLRKTYDVLHPLAKKDPAIAITGGEPTLSFLFEEKVMLARSIFQQVHLITANVEMLRKNHIHSFVSSVTFSLHEPEDVPRVYCKVNNVFAAVMADRYYEALPRILSERGFDGLTINENQWGQKPAFNRSLPDIKNFSIRVNRSGDCIDRTTVLPDLTVIDTFRPFLEGVQK